MLIVGKVWNTHLSVQVMMIVFVLLEMTQIFDSVVTNHPQTDLFPGWRTPLFQLSPSSLSCSPHLVVHSWSYWIRGGVGRQFLRYWHWTNIWTTTESKRIKYIFLFNPLTPMSDQDRTSPYNINTISCRQVMRINTNINQGIFSWSKTKFSKLPSQELYDRQYRELLLRSWK